MQPILTQGRNTYKQHDSEGPDRSSYPGQQSRHDAPN